MCPATESLLAYSSALFVNRQDEIDLVEEKAKAISLGQQIRERTVVFWGNKGTGRTWLLRRLEERLNATAGVKAQYLNLDEWQRCTSEQAIQEITGRTVAQARAWLSRSVVLSSPAVLGDLVSVLPGDVRDLLNEYIFVLLLDHVYEATWDLLAFLEDQFLTSLVVQPHVLIVMAGRGQAYPWKTPELRLYVQDYHLQPFNRTLTQAQLKEQKPEAVPRTSEIHELSQGYPLANYLLAARPTVTQAMQETVEGLLEGVETEERAWLEALCILRTFDEDCIPAILAAYFKKESIASWLYQEIRQVRDRLLHTRMVRWQEKAGGWAVDEAIRPVLERYLQETQPKVWQRLHCAAYRLYQNWKRQYPEEGYRWQAEINHHTQCLRDAGHDPDVCS